MRTILEATLPSALGEVVEVGWSYHLTEFAPALGVGASLVGDEVATSDFGLTPVVSVHEQFGIADELSIAEGRAPDSGEAADVVEVMVSLAVSEALSLEVDTDYTLYPDLLGVMALPPQATGWPQLAYRSR